MPNTIVSLRLPLLMHVPVMDIRCMFMGVRFRSMCMHMGMLLFMFVPITMVMVIVIVGMPVLVLKHAVRMAVAVPFSN